MDVGPLPELALEVMALCNELELDAWVAVKQVAAFTPPPPPEPPYFGSTTGCRTASHRENVASSLDAE